MKAEITLIEDDSDLYNLLRYAFEQDGFKLSGMQTGAGARPVESAIHSRAARVRLHPAGRRVRFIGNSSVCHRSVKHVR